MEGGNRSSDTNRNNINNEQLRAYINARNEFYRNLVLNTMRDVQTRVNLGIIPLPPLLESSTEGTTTHTNRIEDEDNANLVSTVNANIHGLQNLSENIGIRELDERWRGENVDRLRTITLNDESEYEETEDYLTTFKLADNIIVIRFIKDFREGSYGLNYSTETQIIWNSKFTWRLIKEHLEDYTYKFIFKYEVIGIRTSNFTSTNEEEVSNSDTEEEGLNSSVRAAVDALPEFLICREEEKGDEVIMCAICHDTFSIEDSAKQLPCKHFYHSKCILLWFDRSKSCPLCRGEVVLLQNKLLVLNL